jgi:hypothetical protein
MVNKGDRNIALFLCPGNKEVGISVEDQRAPGRVSQTWLYNIIRVLGSFGSLEFEGANLSFLYNPLEICKARAE